MISESEAEAEVSGVVPAVAAAPGASDSGEVGTLMEVTFQKNPRQKYKYLDGEPKILGVTEIGIAVFFIGWRISFYLDGTAWSTNTVILLSGVGIIAGSVAIAAQNLQLQTIKTCLGVQIVTSVAYFICMFITANEQNVHHSICWRYHYFLDKIPNNSTCIDVERLFNHLTLLDELMEAVQIVIALTLAAYCCKVIPCCAPRSSVPVITMTAPAGPQ